MCTKSCGKRSQNCPGWKEKLRRRAPPPRCFRKKKSRLKLQSRPYLRTDRNSRSGFRRWLPRRAQPPRHASPAGKTLPSADRSRFLRRYRDGASPVCPLIEIEKAQDQRSLFPPVLFLLSVLPQILQG